MLSPESQGSIQGNTNRSEEEPKLKTSCVAEVMLVLQDIHETGHTGREGAPSLFQRNPQTRHGTITRIDLGHTTEFPTPAFKDRDQGIIAG
jgi:hypothetical protein